MIENLIENASSYGGKVDWLFTLITILVGFWFVVAEVVLFYFIFKFRARDGVKAAYIAGETKQEKRFISIPHTLILICDVALIAGAINVWVEIKQTLPDPDAKIRVFAQQWAWTFQQPGPDGKLDTEDDITTVDELHLKKDTVYHFELQSRDALHSFSIPAFRLKQDAVPGRAITGWFEPVKTGTFDLQCAEMCGIGHALMVAQIRVETEEEHNAWMAAEKAKAAALPPAIPGGPALPGPAPN